MERSGRRSVGTEMRKWDALLSAVASVVSSTGCGVLEKGACNAAMRLGQMS